MAYTAQIGMPIKAEADVTTPATGRYNLFLNSDQSDFMYKKDSAGVVTSLTSGLVDPMSVRGDIVIRNAANVTARLGVGTAGQFLKSDGTDIAWSSTYSGGVISPVYGGTGISNNAASTLTITGAFATTLTVTGATGVTLPTTGTLATLAGVEELDNKTLDSSVGKGVWTTSGTWTLPAITLGGIVSGGGNQLNNIIIGTVTPLAGAFTTLTGTSSITLGVASTTAGSVILQNATNAFIQTIRGTNPSASITYDLPTTAPTAGQVLQSTAPAAGIATLSWATAASGGDVLQIQIFS